MQERLREPLTVEPMARHAGYSPRSFARRFRAETGTTPLQWLIVRRVAEAQRLLEATDLPVEDVAARAGFGTAVALRQHFGRALADVADRLPPDVPGGLRVRWKPMRELWTCHLGTVEYREAAALQESLRERVIAGELPDLLLLLEHPPVYTLGRRSAAADLPFGDGLLARARDRRRADPARRQADLPRARASSSAIRSCAPATSPRYLARDGARDRRGARARRGSSRAGATTRAPRTPASGSRTARSRRSASTSRAA